MTGQTQEFYIVRFETKRPKTFPDGRTVMLPFTSYYKSKRKEVHAPHLAGFLNEDTAKKIASFYPEKNPKIDRESGYLTDNETLHTALESVGEAVSAQELETTIRAALRVLPKTEIEEIFKRVLA